MLYLYPLRIYQEIGYIVLHQRVRTQDFLNYYSLSSYQYNADIKNIGSLEREYGIHCTFGKEEISFQVTDPQLFNNSRRGLSTFFNQYDIASDSNSRFLLHFQVAELLLQRGDDVRIDDLVEEIGYSRSAMRGPLKQARDYIASYGIPTEALPHHGIRVAGNELRIRRCLAGLYNWFDLNLIRRPANPWLEFLLNEKYQQLADVVNGFFRQRGTVVQQTGLRRLRFYLAIQNMRIKEGKTISSLEDLDSRILNYLTRNPQYMEESTLLCSLLEDQFGFGPYSHQEVLSVALFLFLAREKRPAALAFLRQEYARELQDLIQITRRCLLERYQITLRDEFFENQILQELALILLKHHLGFLQELGNRFGGRSPLMYESPLMLQTGQELAKCFSEYYGYFIPLAQTSGLTDLFAYLIPLLEPTFPPVRIAVESRNSSHGAQMFRWLLLKKFSQRWKDRLQVDCFDHDYAMDHCDTLAREYDLFLQDHKMLGPTSVVYTSQMNNLEQLLYMGRDLCHDTLKAGGGEILARDLTLDGPDPIREFMDRRQAQLADSSQGPLYPGVSCHNRILVMTLTGPKLSRTSLELGNLSQPVTFEDHTADKYVFLSARIAQENLAFYNTLLAELANEPLFFGSLQQTPQFQLVNDRINAILR